MVTELLFGISAPNIDIILTKNYVLKIRTVVYNHWTGMVEWNSGME